MEITDLRNRASEEGKQKSGIKKSLHAYCMKGKLPLKGSPQKTQRIERVGK
jgi:hypothetical protein